jgi:hypothetical protein
MGKEQRSAVQGRGKEKGDVWCRENRKGAVKLRKKGKARYKWYEGGMEKIDRIEGKRASYTLVLS